MLLFATVLFAMSLTLPVTLLIEEFVIVFVIFIFEFETFELLIVKFPPRTEFVTLLLWTLPLLNVLLVTLLLCAIELLNKLPVTLLLNAPAKPVSNPAKVTFVALLPLIVALATIEFVMLPFVK